MQLLREYALSFLNLPYVWGGDDFTGVDCSGLCQLILASCGMDPPGDQTAQGLYNHFERQSDIRHNDYRLGALAFYGESVTKITHVGFVLDQFRLIEAGGAGSNSKTAEDAARLNAFVRIRPIKGRRDLVAVLRPSYAAIGMF